MNDDFYNQLTNHLLKHENEDIRTALAEISRDTLNSRLSLTEEHRLFLNAIITAEKIIEKRKFIDVLKADTNLKPEDRDIKLQIAISELDKLTRQKPANIRIRQEITRRNQEN